MGILGYQCLEGRSSQRERFVPEDAERALGCTAHTRLAQQPQHSVSGWVGVHILGVRIGIYAVSVKLCVCVCVYHRKVEILHFAFTNTSMCVCV